MLHRGRYEMLRPTAYFTVAWGNAPGFRLNLDRRLKVCLTVRLQNGRSVS